MLMFTLSIKIPKKSMFLTLIIIILIFSFIFPHIFKRKIEITPENYLSSLGYEATLIDEKQITLPKKFNSVLQKYNNLQKDQGFDLSKYAGKSCTKKRFSVNSPNIPNNQDTVVDFILFNNKLIGGDLHIQLYNENPMKIDSMS